jgi:hypothetical protein
MVVGLVLGTGASWPVAALVGVAAILGLGGILASSFSLLGASAGLLVAAYTLALVLVAPVPGVVTPALIGGGLALLLVSAETAARGREAPVDPRVLGVWLRDVAGAAVLASASALLLGTVAGTIALGLPAWGYPPLAGLAAVAVVGGTGRALLASARALPVGRGEDA